MVAQFWTQYYHVLTKTGAYGKRRREKYDSSWHVMAKWWWEIRERLPIPRGDGGTTYIPLKNHWIPNKQTMKSIGDLLPIIDLEFLDEDKNVVREWLVNEVEVRTQIEQITQDEWKEVLLTRIPEKAPVARIVADEQLRRKVVKWYEACLETLSNQEGGARTAFASCPLLCCRGDSWEYVATKPRYLDDDNEFVKVFAQDIWLFQIRSDLRSAAREYFGVLSLSGSVEEQIDLGESRSPLSKELQIQLCRSLCFLYAARSSGNRQADEKLLGRLREIEVYIVPDLKANLLFGDVQHEVERRWHATEDKILLHTDHANVTALAQAIARFVGTKSEADFYENLFRCNDDQQRMEKLLSRGMSEAEVRSRLREFVGGDGEEGENSGSGAELDQGHGDITPTGTGPKPAATENKSTMDSHQTETRNGGQDSGEDSSIRRKENETGDNSQGASGGKRTPLKFKDANNCSYHEGKSTGGNSETGGGSGGHGGSGTGTSAPALTEEEKSELEAAGRRIAVRKLEAMGYSVEPMPFENPGFDLSARRNGEELRIEVKAHMGKATVVDVTFRQYREYLNKTGYAWELWNVENLAEDTAEATFTRYNEIPIDALDVRMLRVDLRACQSPS
jgi:hypothetical protein